MSKQNFGNNSFMKNLRETNSLQKTLLDARKIKLFDEGDTGRNINENLEDALFKSVVVVCFGTPMIAGDSFAPLVAESLIQDLDVPCFVYGTPVAPINGKNMERWLDFITVVHKDSIVLAIDASLGERVGSIVVRKDGVCPAAVKGRKKRFGDVGVLGVVAKAGEDPLASLLEAEFDKVASLADHAARLVKDAI